MEINVEVLSFNVTDKPGNLIPESIIIEDMDESEKICCQEF